MLETLMNSSELIDAINTNFDVILDTSLKD